MPSLCGDISADGNWLEGFSELTIYPNDVGIQILGGIILRNFWKSVRISLRLNDGEHRHLATR